MAARAAAARARRGDPLAASAPPLPRYRRLALSPSGGSGEGGRAAKDWRWRVAVAAGGRLPCWRRRLARLPQQPASKRRGGEGGAQRTGSGLWEGAVQQSGARGGGGWQATTRGRAGAGGAGGGEWQGFGAGWEAAGGWHALWQRVPRVCTLLGCLQPPPPLLLSMATCRRIVSGSGEKIEKRESPGVALRALKQPVREGVSVWKSFGTRGSGVWRRVTGGPQPQYSHLCGLIGRMGGGPRYILSSGETDGCL